MEDRRTSGAQDTAAEGDIGVVLEECARLIADVGAACGRAVDGIDAHLASRLAGAATEAESSRERAVLELISGVLERAHGLDKEASRLAELLERAARLLELDEGRADRAGERPTRGARRGAPISEGARILALQMAAAGSSREEIEQHLHQRFGISHSALAELFGDLGHGQS